MKMDDAIPTVPETRKFTVDESIIGDLITKQAGSLSKAIIELVMNSVDAGATKIDIRIDEEGFSVKDDGKGFVGRTEVLNFFERFGTPHQEGDALFGRFRIGRGQIMAFARCQWRSGTFQMDTDFRGKGTEYEFLENLDTHYGCTVKGSFYGGPDDRGSSYWWRPYELEKSLAYLGVKIDLNGERISKDIDAMEWEINHDLFYFSEDVWGDRLEIYSAGVYVCDFPKRAFGRCGVLVTKKPIAVNFARNAILEDECPSWKHITTILQESVAKRRPASRLIKAEDRETEYHLFLDGKTDVFEFIRLRLLEDVDGNVFSFSSISKDIVNIVSASERRMPLSEHINAQDTCFVFAPHESRRFSGDLEWFYGTTRKNEAQYICDLINAVHDRLKAVKDDISFLDPRHEKLHEILDWTGRITVHVRFDELESRFPTTRKALPLSALGEEETELFREIKRASNEIHGEVYDFLCRTGKISEADSFPLRKLTLGDSLGSALAWTDGASFIAIDIAYLKKMYLRFDDGVFDLILTVLHEYCHLDSDIDDHSHDKAFYELYHNVLNYQYKSMFDVSYRTSKRLYNRLVKKDVKINSESTKRYGK